MEQGPSLEDQKAELLGVVAEKQERVEEFKRQLMEKMKDGDQKQEFLSKYFEKRRKNRYIECVHENDAILNDFLSFEELPEKMKEDSAQKAFAKYDIRYRCAQRFKYKDPKLEMYEPMYLEIKEKIASLNAEAESQQKEDQKRFYFWEDEFWDTTTKSPLMTDEEQKNEMRKFITYK